MNKALVVRVCGLAAILAACSSDSKSSWGLDPNQTLSTLSVDQRKQFCRSDVKCIRETISWAQQCKANALFDAQGASSDADVQAACKTSYDACMSSVPDSSAPSDTDAEVVACLTQAWTCDITVGQAVACVSDSSDATDKWITSLPSCSSATVQGVASLRSAPEPDSCKTWNKLCQ